MTETDPVKDGFGEYENLAAVLRAADLSGESKVRDSLKNRLLGKAAPEVRSFAFPRWLFPAAAAALGVLALAVFLSGRKPDQPPSYLTYNAPADAYGDCGRQGLKDYLPKPAF